MAGHLLRLMSFNTGIRPIAAARKELGLGMAAAALEDRLGNHHHNRQREELLEEGCTAVVHILQVGLAAHRTAAAAVHTVFRDHRAEVVVGSGRSRHRTVAQEVALEEAGSGRAGDRLTRIAGTIDCCAADAG